MFSALLEYIAGVIGLNMHTRTLRHQLIMSERISLLDFVRGAERGSIKKMKGARHLPAGLESRIDSLTIDDLGFVIDSLIALGFYVEDDKDITTVNRENRLKRIDEITTKLDNIVNNRQFDEDIHVS